MADRKYLIKKVKNPDDDSQFVLVPTLAEWEVVDPKTRNQEFHFSLENSVGDDGSKSDRKVRVVDLTGSDGSSQLKVERVLRFSTTDAKSKNQEQTFILNNDNSDDPGPHKKVHTRYWTEPPEAALPDVTQEPTGADAWIKMEVMDQFEVTDPKTANQEWLYDIANPKDGSDIPDPSNSSINESKGEGISESGESIPWRFDPFQNPVDVSWGNQDFVVIAGGPRDDAKTLVWIKFIKGVPDIAIERLPYSAVKPDFVTDAGLDGIEAAEVNQLDYWGNLSVSADDGGGSNIFYDKSGITIPGTSLPPPPINSDPRGKAVFSDDVGTIFCTTSSTKKWTLGARTSSTVMWELTSGPGAGTDGAAFIDKESGDLVLVSVTHVVRIDVTSGDIISTRDLNINESSGDSSGLIGTFTSKTVGVDDVAKDGSYVVTETNVTSIADTTNFPGDPPDLRRNGTFTTSGTQAIVKYDWKGHELWTIGPRQLDQNLTEHYQSTVVVADNSHFGTWEIFDNFSEKSHFQSVCIGQYVLEIYFKSGYYDQVSPDFWVYFTSTDGGVHLNGPFSAGTSYGTLQHNAYIDVIDKNGDIVKTIAWGANYHNGGDGLPIDWGGTPPPDFYDSSFPQGWAPWPTTSISVNSGSIRYWNGYINDIVRKPRFPDPR